MNITIGRSAISVVPVSENYRKFDGDHVTLMVVAVPGIATKYSAVAANGRTITLNGYAFAKEFQDLCDALGVPCNY